MLNFEKINQEEMLSNNVPENLTKEWEDIPENYVSVYHFTSKEALKGISEKGIKHYSDIIPKEQLSPYQNIKITVDEIFDEVSKELGINHKRSGSIFASPETTDNKQTMGKGDVSLEIKQDPQKIIVSDGKLVTATANSWFKTEEGKNWLEDHPEFIETKEDKEQFEKLQKEFNDDYKEYIRSYWEDSVTLEEWNKLSDEEKSKLFQFPEVIIENGVDPKFIRVEK